MKKYLIILVLLAGSVLFSPTTSAQSQNCQTVNFPDGSVCVWIQKISSGEYRVRSTVSSNQSTVSLRCDIEYGQWNRQYVWSCDDRFYYASNSTEQVSIDIWLNDNQSKRITRNYNFRNGSWSSSWNNDYNNDCYYYNNCNYYNDVYDLNVSASSIYPSVNQYVDVDIMALRSVGSIDYDYNERVYFSVEYRSSSSSSWQTASSSRYRLNRTSYLFRSSDNGSVSLDNLIQFRNNGQYRLVVRDNNNNINRYVHFTVWGSSWNNNNNTLQTFSLSASDQNTNTYQPIDVTIRARDRNNNTITNYTERVHFSVEYRSSTSNSWQTASSSRYRLNKSSYSFSWNDNGSVTLHDLIEFRNNGQYRLVVRDNNNNVSNWIQFYVGSTNNNNNQYSSVENFRVTASRTNPSTYQSVNVTIQARDSFNRIVRDYTRNVSLRVQYRPYSNSSWQNAPSSRYTLNRNNYIFSWSNYGSVTLNSLLQFRSNGIYRLVVEDSWNNIVGYVTFNVGWSNNYNPYNPWFTNNEINQIQGIYNIWPAFIDKLKNDYPTLRNHNTWNNRQAALYQQMNNVLNNHSSIYNNYDQFFDAFRDRYIYTLQIRD